MMNIVVFDLETKAHPGKDCTWEEKDKMGVSVGVAFNYASGEYQVFLDDNLEVLATMLESADLVTGFNIISFDIPLLVETLRVERKKKAQDQFKFGPMDVEARNACFEVIDGRLDDLSSSLIKNSYDIFPVSKKGAFPDASDEDRKYKRGFKCDDHLRALYGDRWLKTADGAEAPQMYKDGRMGELINYCMADVHRERLLFEQCWYGRRLRSKGFKDGQEGYDVEPPQISAGVEGYTR